MRKRKWFAFFVFLLVVSDTCLAAGGSLALTPDKVKEILLTQGAGVKILKLDRSTMEKELAKAQSRYDTALTLSGDHTFDKSARISTFFGGSKTDTDNWNLGLSKKTPTGTAFGFQFLNQRRHSHGANPLAGSSLPTYESAFEFRVTQSLGKNFFGGIDRGEVETTQRRIEAFDFETKDQINKRIVYAQTLFWNWVVARERIRIAREALMAAEDFLRITREKKELGLVEETDFLGAKALVSKRMALLESSRLLADEWEVKIRDILSIPRGIVLHPKGFPLRFPKMSESSMIYFGLENRFDLKRAKKNLEEREIRLAISKREQYPLIDLENTLTLNEIRRLDYGDVLTGTDSPKWTVGLLLTYPLENRNARGLKEQAEYAKLKALLEVKDLERHIVNVIVQKRGALILARRIDAARREAIYIEQEKLGNAIEQYLRARFSAELILQYQNDFLEARQEGLEARLQLALALLNLKEAMNKGLLIP